MQVDSVRTSNPERAPFIPKPTSKTAIDDAVAELRCIADIMVVLGEQETQDDGSIPGAWMAWLGNCVSNAAEELHSALRALDKNAKPV